MDLKLTPAEAAEILRRRHAKAVRAERGQRITSRPFQGRGQETDPAYISWLHGLPCIACLILIPAPREHAHIEAAHQKAQDAARGWHKILGRRVHDRQSCPLCAWHHRLAPACCDPAQGKFWSMLGVDVIDFCNALYAAFKAAEDGPAVVRKIAAPVIQRRREQRAA